MDRIVEVKVNGNYITKDNKNAGVQGEYNMTALRIEFDEGWDGFAKHITWWNSLHQNPVEVILTADLLEDLSKSTRIYTVLIPGEPLEFDGMCSFVIDGYVDGKRQRSVEDFLEVKPADTVDDAGKPVDPTPSQAEQLQVQIDALLGNMQAEANRAETAAGAAEDAQEAAEEAQSKAEDAQEAAETAKTGAESAQKAAEEAKVGAEAAKGKAEDAQRATETAKTGAENAQKAAEEAAVAAARSASNANSDAAAALAGADRAEDAQEAAETAAGAASGSATAAASAATSAGSSAGAAQTAQEKAEQAKSAAETAKSGAETAKSKAETAQSEAEKAKAAAETAQGKAEDAQSAAEGAQTAAETAQAAAAESAAQAAQSAQEAGQSDWNENDSTKASHVLNRPFYREDVTETLNWANGSAGSIQINGAPELMYAGETYCLMADSVGHVPSYADLCKGGTVAYQNSDESFDEETGLVIPVVQQYSFGGENEENLEPIIFAGNVTGEATWVGDMVLVVHMANTPVEDVTVETPGVYFRSDLVGGRVYRLQANEMYLQGFEFGGAYHPIPEEYLPKGVYGDNLEFDTETSLLWLTSDGIRIGEGIKVATSGGGGGSGESNNAVLTLKNTTGWMYKTISQGAECSLAFEWSSLEEGLATGNGVLKITVNGTTKHTAQIEQGSKSVDVGPYLSAGENAVKLNVTDVYGNSRSLSFTLTVVALELTSTFDSSVAYSGAISFPYTPTAAVEKTMHFLVDGTEIGTATVTASGRQQTYTIPAQSHGAHTLEAYFTATVEGEEVESDWLHYAIICTEAGNETPIVAVDWQRGAVEQYETLSIPYMVYDPLSLTAKVSLYSDQTGDEGELTVDRTRQTWSYRVENAGSVTLNISCVGASGLGATAALGLLVTETSIEVEAEQNDLALHLTSYGRSNNEANPSVWSYGNVAAELTGFNYTSDGWMEDEQGITVLRVGGDARVEIPVQLFAQDFRTTGKTIEIEFASRSVLDYDAILATCWSGGRGFEITAQQATLKSEKSEVTTRYKEDDHLRLSFVIEKRSGNRLILGYVNGIISGMMQYPDSDDFSQAVPVTISLGSNDCTIDIYNIRVYDNDLDRFQMLNNWIADTQDLGEKKDRYDRNNIFDDYDRILPETLRPQQKYLVIDCPVLPTYKGDKKTCSGRYVDPVDEKNSFTFEGAEIDVQGTSSQFYYVKNFKIKFKGGFVQNGTTKTVYAMNAKAVPTAEFTFKADVASSEGANNVVLAEMYNELCPVKTPAQERDSRVRQTIEGHPIVVFHDDGSGAKFIGKYNFNNDKGTAEVFGFAEGDESWEIKENGNALVSFKTSDFTNWQTAFEARYPEDNTDITKLQQFVAWVASTNTEGKTGTAKQALLDKFKSELAEWVDVDDAIFYYLFTLVFLCIDQREKNAFPTWNAEMAKWLWLFYDADSSIGTDNKGNLTFEYWMEDIDFTEAGDPVFNGQNNVFWSNLRECFPDEIRDEYRRLRTELGDDGKALLSYDKVNELFTAHQSQWSEAIYNEDAWRKAVEPLEKVNDPQYLPMQQGKKEQHFKHWMYNRFRYLDSKFETGAALDDENRIMMRAHAQGNIWLTSYINMYGQVYYNSERSENRMVRDTAYEFPWTAQGAEDAVIGVNSAPMITSLGDLSPLMLEYCHIQYASHLTELKVGDAAANYVNDNFVALTLGNNKLLRKLDVRNCTALTQAVDASGCTNIEEVYFDGTGIAGLSLPNGGILKKLHLPGTITDLTLRNQTKLEEFVLPGYSNITTLRLENSPACVDGYSILRAIPANSRVRMIGFDWSVDSVDSVFALYDYLDTMRGLDENGNNVDKPQMQGSIRIDSLTGAQLAEMQSRYPSISIVYQHITSNLYFYDDTGSTLLYTAIVADGGDGSYGGSTPTKASTAQYTYAFANGWSLAPGGSANANALKAVTKDRSVYAVFTATVRKYTVYWKNGSTTLETDTNVPYGTVPTYNGSTPVYSGTEAEDYEFSGWSPAVEAVTGDTTYTAQFKYNGYYYVKVLDRSLSGAYTNETVTQVGQYALSYSNITSLSLPAVTDIGQFAFYYTKATTVDIPECLTVSSQTFGRSGLTTLHAPKLKNVGYCTFEQVRAKTLDLPSVTRISDNGFYNSSGLTAVILRSETMCVLDDVGAFDNTPIENDGNATGYVYVPSALVDTYKADSVWSSLASRIRAIEDYPDITGG